MGKTGNGRPTVKTTLLTEAEVSIAAKRNHALRMKARLLSFGFSLLLQPQDMCA